MFVSVLIVRANYSRINDFGANENLHAEYDTVENSVDFFHNRIVVRVLASCAILQEKDFLVNISLVFIFLEFLYDI